MIEFCAEYPFIQLPTNHYAGFAYDGHFTYLSSNDRQIVVCDENNAQVKTIQTTRFYHTICYDPGLDCLWAAGQDSPGTLYCLSHEMEEIKKINLDNYNEVIQGLSYVRHNDSFMFFNNEQIYSVTRTGEIHKLGEDEKRKGYTLEICAIEQGLLRLSLKQHHYYMSFLFGRQMWSEEVLSRDAQARGMVVFPDKNDEGITCIRIFAVKSGRKPYIFDYKFDTRLYCAPNQPQGANDFPFDDKEPEVKLSGVKPFCPQQSCAKPGCPTSCKPPSCDETSCSGPCKPAECCACDCCENYAKVLESIALAEAGIAHILNAEGEKLQKAIQECVSICELLKVNASVQKTIVCATHLEHTLYNKLEALLQIDCKTCPAPCPKPCPSPCPPPCQKHCTPSKCTGNCSGIKRNENDENDEAEENGDSIKSL